MKDFLKKYWWFILIILLSPVAINYMLLFPAIGPVVGDNVHWLSFWGSYLAALLPTVGAFMILYIQRRDSLGENEKRRKENEDNRNLQINILKYQQEMQWLNENRSIVLDFVLSLNRNDLKELSAKLAIGQDVMPGIKSLLARLVENDSRVGFMRVSEETPNYHEFNSMRMAAFDIYRDTILDLQEIYILFLKTNPDMRRAVLRNHQQQNLINKGLKNIIETHSSEESFLKGNAFDISTELINALPDLLGDTRKTALAYIKAEEQRISKLLITAVSD